MKKSLGLFLLCLVGITVLVAVNRWDVPVTIWLCTVFALTGLFSGMYFLVVEVGC